MKIVVLHDNNHTLVDDSFDAVPLTNLGEIEDASCDLIHLNDCMDYVNLSVRDQLLLTAIKKLRKNGELLISGTDTIELVSQYYNHSISIQQLNASIYDGRLSIDSLFNLQKKLKKITSLSIVNAKLDGVYYSIKCKRTNEILE